MQILPALAWRAKLKPQRSSSDEEDPDEHRDSSQGFTVRVSARLWCFASCRLGSNPHGADQRSWVRSSCERLAVAFLLFAAVHPSNRFVLGSCGSEQAQTECPGSPPTSPAPPRTHRWGTLLLPSRCPLLSGTTARVCRGPSCRRGPPPQVPRQSIPLLSHLKQLLQL